MPGSISQRVIDVAVTIAAAPLAVPLVLALMGLVRFDSPGPALFVQQRIGFEKRPFGLLKLRTMATGTADLPSHEVAASRITRVGRFLRATKLDELPQLWNIFRGQMTFVGPRPCLAGQIELIEERESRGMYSILPGVTGPAQIRNIDMSDPVRLAEVEQCYFDVAKGRDHLAIVLRTLLGSGRGDAITHAGRESLPVERSQ